MKTTTHPGVSAIPIVVEFIITYCLANGALATSC